jgi:hypothetical protein
MTKTLLDSFRTDRFYISRDRAVQDLVLSFSDRLRIDESYFSSVAKAFLRKEDVKRIFVDNGTVWQDDYLELENLLREKLYNNTDRIERMFKNKHGIEVKYEEDKGLLSLKYSDKSLLPPIYTNCEVARRVNHE